MFIVNVLAGPTELYDFLDKESTLVPEKSYAFSSIQKASEIFSQFTLSYLKEKEINLFFKKNQLDAEELSSFTLFIPSDRYLSIRDSITTVFNLYFQDQHDLDWLGFYPFRLKNHAHSFHELYEETLREFITLTPYQTNLSSFKQSFREQPCIEPFLYLSILTNGTTTLRNGHKVFITEKTENFDTILGYIFLLAPQKLVIYGPIENIAKEFLLIMNYLLDGQVVCFNEQKYL